MKAKINITNPSPYSASLPFVDLILVYNDTKVAHVTARDLAIVPGVNSGIHADLQWNPLELGGSAGVTAGQEMLSQYVSGEFCIGLGTLLDGSVCLTTTRLQHVRNNSQS